MSVDSEQAVLQVMPERTSSHEQDITKLDIAYIICAFCTGVMSFVILPHLYLIVVLVLALAGYKRYEHGRGYRYVALFVQEMYLISRGSVLWRAETGASKRRLTRKHPVMRMGTVGVATSDGMLGLMSQPDSKTDNFVVVGRGSDISALEVVGQQAAQQDLAEVIKRTASTVDYPIGVSYVLRRRPVEVQQLNSYLGNSLSPDVSVPEALIKPLDQLNQQERVALRQHKHVNDLLQLYGSVSRDVVMAAVITVKRHPKWRSAGKRGALKVRDIDQSPMAQMARMLEADFKNLGVKGAQVLGLADINRYLRLSWDVTGLPGYYADRFAGNIPTTDQEIVFAQSGEMVSDMQAFPTDEIIVGHDFCKIGDTYHSTIKLTRCPDAALPGFFGRLYALNVPDMSIALVSETMSGTQEAWKIKYVMAMTDAYDRSRNYTVMTEKEKEKRQKQRDWDAQQHHSGSVLQLYNILISVSASSEEELRRRRDTVLSTTRVMRHVKAKTIKWRALQVPALLSATTGVNQI